MSQANTWGFPRIADAPTSPEAVAIRADESLDALLSSHSGAARPTYLVAGGIWHSSTTLRWYRYDGTLDIPIPHAVAAVPATAGATGIVGDYFVNATYRYECVATDTWVRVALATW